MIRSFLATASTGTLNTQIPLMTPLTTTPTADLDTQMSPARNFPNLSDPHDESINQ